MGYLKIPNLYKNQEILMFRECWALEKVHGTSTHLAYKDGALRIFSGGIKPELFEAAFDKEALAEAFAALGHQDIVVYGEGYGGKCLRMSKTYGKETRFVAFDVKIGGYWLDVPNAAEVVRQLGLEFVDYVRTPSDIELLNELRDAPSALAARRGCGDQIAEGVVLRPILEMQDRFGNRIIAKHKRLEFSETKTPRDVSPESLQAAKDAEWVAQEWVTDMRLQHVMDKVFGSEKPSIERTGDVVRAMQDDVQVEGAGEIVWNENVKRMIGRRAAALFKRLVTALGLVLFAGCAWDDSGYHYRTYTPTHCHRSAAGTNQQWCGTPSACPPHGARMSPSASTTPRR